jgi:hypothetical protein
MLQRSAPRLSAYQLHALVIAQHANVIAHDAERRLKLDGEIAWTRDSLPEPLQDPSPQRMSQRLRNPRL